MRVSARKTGVSVPPMISNNISGGPCGKEEVRWSNNTIVPSINTWCKYILGETHLGKLVGPRTEGGDISATGSSRFATLATPFLRLNRKPRDAVRESRGTDVKCFRLTLPEGVYL